MNYQEALSFIHHTDWMGSRLGLDRMRTLMGRLGDPQKRLRFVHVAGTNGKGSTCAILAAILTAAGYRTGMYISPHLVRVNERISVNGREIGDEELISAAERVKQAVDEMDEQPTEFEIITAMALCCFEMQQCDIVVLEVGMGGRLDATNIIPSPEAAVITNIGLEHTEILGDTLEKIAGEKSGIIKEGCACVCYDSPPEVRRTVAAACREKKVPFRQLDFSRVHPLQADLAGQRFLWDQREYRLALLGPHQLHNAALALTAIEALRDRGWRIPDAAVETSLRGVKWPARFEVMHHAPLFILDGAHNPQCAEALEQSLKTLLPDRKMVFLTGVLADKDLPGIVGALLPWAERFVCVTPDNPRRLAAEELGAYLRKQGAEVKVAEEIDEGLLTALELAEERDCPCVTFGSLYLAGTIRDHFHPVLKRLQRKKCIAARRALPQEERELHSAVICDALRKLPALQRAQTILSYAAAWDEADLAAFDRWAAENGKTVAYPIPYENGRMEAAVPAGAPLVPGPWGIRIPDPEHARRLSPDEIDAVLTPCVGFDRQGGRLGHGGGYYDRYFLLCKRACKILVGFEVQRISEIAQTETDQEVSLLVTERGAQVPAR